MLLPTAESPTLPLQVLLGGSKPRPDSRICITSLSGKAGCNSLDEVLLEGADAWQAALWDDTHT